MAGGFGRISAEDAYRATMRQPDAKWPGRGSPRLDPVARPASRASFTLAGDASVFTIGSCFARNIEIALRNRGLRVPTLDLQIPPEELMKGSSLRTGILNKYTPFSMLNEIEQLGRDDDGDRFLIELGEDAWWDGQLHSHEAVTRERGLKRRRRIRRLYNEAIAQSALVIVTLGLVEAWWDEAEQLYLNDTVPRHVIERYPGRFFFEVLSPEKVNDAVMRLVATLHDMNPAQRMLLTVSPVPLHRSFTGGDVLSANNYSKSALRVAAEIAVRSFGHVDYFPSFESVTLSDRKIAWEDDLAHVMPALVEDNVARMIEAYIPTAAEGAA
jgi:GSCFA family protein